MGGNGGRGCENKFWERIKLPDSELVTISLKNEVMVSRLLIK